MPNDDLQAPLPHDQEISDGRNRVWKLAKVFVSKDKEEGRPMSDDDGGWTLEPPTWRYRTLMAVAGWILAIVDRLGG